MITTFLLPDDVLRSGLTPSGDLILAIVAAAWRIFKEGLPQEIRYVHVRTIVLTARYASKNPSCFWVPFGEGTLVLTCGFTTSHLLQECDPGRVTTLNRLLTDFDFLQMVQQGMMALAIQGRSDPGKRSTAKSNAVR